MNVKDAAPTVDCVETSRCQYKAFVRGLSLDTMASVFYLTRMSWNVTPSLIDPTVRSSYPTTAVRSGEKDVRISVIGSIRVTHDMQQEHRRRILLNSQVTTPRLCYVPVFKVPQHCFERAGLSRSFVFVATTHSRPAHARNTTEATPEQGAEVLYKVRPYNELSSMLAELESASATQEVVEPKLPEPCLFDEPKFTRFPRKAEAWRSHTSGPVKYLLALLA